MLGRRLNDHINYQRSIRP